MSVKRCLLQCKKNINYICEIWSFHRGEKSNRGLLGCDSMLCCGRIPIFHAAPFSEWRLWPEYFKSRVFWVMTLCSVVIGYPTFQRSILCPSSGWSGWYGNVIDISTSPWRWGQHGALKRWYPITTLDRVTTQKNSKHHHFESLKTRNFDLSIFVSILSSVRFHVFITSSVLPSSLQMADVLSPCIFTFSPVMDAEYLTSSSCLILCYVLMFQQ